MSSPNIAGATDPKIADGTAQQELDAAIAGWQAAGLVDYHYTIARICFCAPAFRGPVPIVVRDGQALGPAQEFADEATVPQLHAVVQKAISDQVERLNVSYDALGVPASIEVDPSTMIADDEVTLQVSEFAADHPRTKAKGDFILLVLWRGSAGNAIRIVRCRDGVILGGWPDSTAGTRILATPALAQPITVETRDLRSTPDTRFFSALGHIEGHPVAFVWRGQGSSTRLARLQAWETALGPQAVATVRSA